MDRHIPVGAPADLYISEALDNRPPGKIDHRGEGRAIQELAFRMSDDPESVLPLFVDLAIQITGAASAGLSLYEDDGADGVFRWRHLRGTLSPFENATTPRNFSPCGITLDRNAPVLTSHPERVYDWIVEAGVVAPEVLLVPMAGARGEPIGTLWVVAEQEGLFNRDHARLLDELARCVSAALQARAAEPAARAHCAA